MSDLLKRMQKTTSIPSSILSESRFFGDDIFYNTGYPMLNLALSGKLNGGLTNGMTFFAGPSKHFKSNYLCLCMAAYQKAKPDGVILFYDSEFGAKESYFKSFGIDTDRVIHIPIMDIEEFKFDIMKKLKEEITADDDIMISVDSFGNIASKKEVEDAVNEKSVADMTRAKQMKSFGRMVTPHLAMKKIPMVAVNHTYETQEMYSKTVMSGGTGLMYSSDTVILVGRSQNKEGKELAGYNFDLVIDKSRYVKERSRLPIVVSYEGGVDKYSGLFDLMLKHTDLVEQSGAWYTVKGAETKVRKNDILSDTKFMDDLLKNEDFVKSVEKEYALPIIGGPTPILEEAIV